MTHKPTYEELEQRVLKLEKKLKAAQLVEQEEKYRALFFYSPIGIFSSTFEGRFIDVNPALAKMLGYESPEDVIKNICSIGEQFYVSSEISQEIVSDQMKYEGISHHLNHYRRKDGSEFIANLYLKTVSDIEGNPLYLVGIVEDVTKQKLAEEALRNSEAQKRAILDSSLDSIRLVDRDMRIIWTNKLIETQLQKKRKKLIGDYCYHAYTGRNEPCPNCPTKKALKSGKTEHSIIIEENVKGMEGISYWADYAVPIKNESEEIVNFIQVSRDITDIKKAEKALMEEKNKLAVTLAKVKKLSGMLPICSYCKKIRQAVTELNKYITI